MQGPQTQCYKLAPQPALLETQGWKSGSHSRDGTTTILLSQFSKMVNTMLGDEYISMVFHDVFLASWWCVQRASCPSQKITIFKLSHTFKFSKAAEKCHFVSHFKSNLGLRRFWTLKRFCDVFLYVSVYLFLVPVSLPACTSAPHAWHLLVHVMSRFSVGTWNYSITKMINFNRTTVDK